MDTRDKNDTYFGLASIFLYILSFLILFKDVFSGAPASAFLKISKTMVSDRENLHTSENSARYFSILV